MTNETLQGIYDELKQMRDEIKLKMHLGGMELRDQWEELEGEWKSWTHQLGQELSAGAEDVESKIREAGGDDLRKAEIKTKLAVSKLKKGYAEVAEKLKEQAEEPKEEE